MVNLAGGDIELIGVSKRFDQSVAVDALSLKIPNNTYCKATSSMLPSIAECVDRQDV